MKLLDLVKYFRNGGVYEKFRQAQSLDDESEVVEINMKQPLKIDSELVFLKLKKQMEILRNRIMELNTQICSTSIIFWMLLKNQTKQKSDQ